MRRQREEGEESDERGVCGIAGEGGGGGKERIQVSVRLRPLNAKELERNEPSDWECINDTTIIFRNSLPERSMTPIAYNFDRVFRCDSTTKQVYEEGAKEVSLSVLSGINASIFAYGQTSSGKTYTMTGITELAMCDIYDYIQRHQERAFVLKFSAIEIYNEAVKDLLGTESVPLRLLDDPYRGTVIEKLTEETLMNWAHMKELLSICEAQRQIGETLLNETSSRSHQILRLTVESSARESVGEDHSSALSASLDFVDLAGSERASQALSAGVRLKEGCHINRSLLTLGSVIRKLSSQGRNGHIPYRDSKLTRILQPSLGGNARTAIICTLSPARGHVEQSKNTLLFAGCAKEVVTNAKVNHLQRELARLEGELRCPRTASSMSQAETLLKEKDAQIEKMGREIKELTRQRDLAQSRLEDLLTAAAEDRGPRRWEPCSCDPSGASQDLSSSICSGNHHQGSYREVHCVEQDDWRRRNRGDDESGEALNYRESGHEDQESVTGQQEAPHSFDRSRPHVSPPLTLVRSPPYLERDDHTPPSDSLGGFPGRPEKFQVGFLPFIHGRPELEPSERSLDEHEAEGDMAADAEQDMASIRAFADGLKEMAQAQAAEGTAAEETPTEKPWRNPPASPSSSPREELEKKRREIVELWHACDIPLLHRTFFFLLFKGDPGDSAYMEVEWRRLSSLRRASAQGNLYQPVPEDIRPSSSARALRRERGMLRRRMQRRLSPEEREGLYREWGIPAESKRRKARLVRLLWSDPGNMELAEESASIIAKLVGLPEPDEALKEALGLQFLPQRPRRRSQNGWRKRDAVSDLSRVLSSG
ncbi:unnamed protein product [Spirodela intermedia]|uniref:Kinesin-like protein n=1 Tax=Spirodela intermedia TaxID=51605 RepID=A0A7I8JB06_SPIIN|nr:unnamed protein product [Spirodela intermedia]CAA6666905.1 unnamed protein product [Spirodela intermedia]